MKNEGIAIPLPTLLGEVGDPGAIPQPSPKNVVSWIVMIDGYARKVEMEGARLLF